MAWGSDTDAQVNGAASPQNVVGTELFSDDITLNPEETAVVQVYTDSGGTTDSLDIAIYTTLDDATEKWDTVAMLGMRLDATSGDEEVVTLVISGVYKFRVGVVRAGSTDTLATGIFYRKNGVSV